MADVENTVAAEEAMTVENQQESGVEVAAEQLMQNIAGAEEPAQEEEQETQPTEEEQTEETTDSNPYAAGLQTLFEDGWTQENIAALITDPTALKEMRDGKTVRQAAFAFLQRSHAAEKPAAKKSVPTFRSAATSGAKETNKIDSMTSEEFAEFSRRAKEAMMDGKLVSFK